jgi:hypothetical protein
MPLPSVKSLPLIAAEKAAAEKAQRDADYAKFLVEATKAKPRLRRELEAKIEAKVLAAPNAGEVEVLVFEPGNSASDYNRQRTKAYFKVWQEVIAAWAAAQQRKGYTVSPRILGADNIIVKVTWPRG